MAIKKTELGGDSKDVKGVIGYKKTSKVGSKFNNLNILQRLLLFSAIGVVIVGLVITLTYVIFNINSQENENQPTVELQIDPAELDRALEQFQNDPSSIPSGEFHPEQADSFIVDDGEDNAGAEQP